MSGRHRLHDLLVDFMNLIAQLKVCIEILDCNMVNLNDTITGKLKASVAKKMCFERIWKTIQIKCSIFKLYGLIKELYTLVWNNTGGSDVHPCKCILNINISHLYMSHVCWHIAETLVRN